MGFHSVLIETRDEVTVVRFNRPPANAFCLELAREIAVALETEEVIAARALVLTGTGPFFSGGLDLKAVPTYSEGEQREFLGVVNRVGGKLYAWPGPVVAAVNGHAIAAGFIIALAADYRVGTSDPGALFGLTEARVGIPFPAVPMIILRAELAPVDVRYTSLYARNYGAPEARERGLLDELQPSETVLERAIEVARDMASMPADAYRRIKHQVRRDAIAQIDEVIAANGDPMLAGWLSPDARAASAGVLEAAKTGRGKPSGQG